MICTAFASESIVRLGRFLWSGQKPQFKPGNLRVFSITLDNRHDPTPVRFGHHRTCAGEDQIISSVQLSGTRHK
jgi:hypothetical protein